MIHQRKKGFTLIELIIAITILAILAVGLIAALDPVEQLTKARDTTVRDNVDTIAGAFERYYAVNETYDNATNSLSGMTNLNGTTTNDNNPAVTNQGEALINTLMSVGELKSGFTTANAANLAKIWIYKKDVNLNGVDVATPVICTKVDSKAFSSQKGLYTIDSDNNEIADSSLAGGLWMPEYRAVPVGSAFDCTLVSSTARNYCAFCIELQK